MLEAGWGSEEVSVAVLGPQGLGDPAGWKGLATPGN